MTTRASDRDNLILDHRWIAEKVAKRIWLAITRTRGNTVVSLERDDIEQSALVGVIQAADKYRPDSEATFATYAWRAAFNEARKMVRKAFDENVHYSLKDKGELPEAAVTPQSEEAFIFQQSVRDVLDGESDVVQWIFLAYYFMGETMPKIAGDLNMSKQNVHRVLARLEEKLK